MKLPSSTRSAQDAAQAIGCNVCQIAKSLIFRTQRTGKPVLVIVSGSNRVDTDALGKLMGEGIIKPDADFVRQVTGFSIGGVPPVGHHQVLETYIDADLLAHDEIWAAAGTPHAVLRLTGDDLVTVTQGTVVQVAS